MKPKGYGYYTPESLYATTAWQNRPDGDWEPARPEPHYSLKERLRYAWHILTYKADPLYWYFPKGWKRTPEGLKKRPPPHNK